MTRTRALIVALALTTAVGAAVVVDNPITGTAEPVAASQDFPPYVDCAGAMGAASGGTGRFACFDKFTPYGPIFQVFNQHQLIYAAPYTDLSPASLPNHLWYGSEWVPAGCCPQGYPSNGITVATGTRTMNTWGYTAGCCNTRHKALSSDPGLLAWWYHAANDGTLNVVWLTH